ncbi:MAG: NAD(P)H-dependent oxidoreductase [Syntrophales bacterium]|jgi:glutathione-regulated potassium-efflux system ancillary protein KefG|nr:NAD(P)H-dependent oxidoreductase [Syntrophales bacterium]
MNHFRSPLTNDGNDPSTASRQGEETQDGDHFHAKRVLILFAHPRFEKSRVNRVLLNALPVSDAITLHDLYELYPDYNIDVEAEKQLLITHDILIWHHPFYMYSAPAILKQWMDLVLEYGWAHGDGGDFLKDKTAFNAITTGGTREAYRRDGFNRFTIREFLCPFEQTARLCKMTYLPPFAVQGTYRLTNEELTSHATDYAFLLQQLAAGAFDRDREEMEQYVFLNDWIAAGQRTPTP